MLYPAAAKASVQPCEISTADIGKWLTEHDREAERLAEIDRLRARAYRQGPLMRNALLRRRAKALTGEVEQ